MKELRGQRCYSEKVYRKYIHRQAYFLGSYYSSTEVHTLHSEEYEEHLYKTNHSGKPYRRIVRVGQTSKHGVHGGVEQYPDAFYL